MRENRDALVITVVGGLLVTVGGGVILAGVVPGLGGDSGGEDPIVVKAEPQPPTIITVSSPSPDAPAQGPAQKAQKTAAQPVAATEPAATRPPAPPPPAPQTKPQPPPAPKVVTTAAGTTVPEGSSAKLLNDRLTVTVGQAAGATLSRLVLRAAGEKCVYAAVRVNDLAGIRISRKGAVGVKVVAVTATGATLKAAASRAPRRAPTCIRARATSTG